jgi:cell division protein FtsW
MFYTLGERTAVKTGSRARRIRSFKSVVSGFGIQAPAVEDENPIVSKPLVSKWSIRFHFDLPLVLILFTLIVFGLLMVFSASYDYSAYYYDGDTLMILHRQLMWLGLGLIILLVLFFMDYHTLAKFAVPMMAVTIGLLIIVLLVNEIRNGAARTLFKGSIQPSELAKLVIILYLAVWLNARKDQLGDMRFGLIPLALILGILGGLIIIQPDLSAVLTIMVLGGLMFYLAGGDLKQILLLLVVMILIGSAVIMLHSTGRSRINDFIVGLQNPTGGSYHVTRSLESFVNGGWFGVGIGKATGKLTGLPVPPTDSIFAVVGEETGILGAMGLVALYSLLLWRGVTIALRAPDKLGSLLATGLSIWICFEAFINMSVLIGILPFAGNALPFISAGGSNLVASLAAMGIVLNISRLSAEEKEEKGKHFNAVVDLRGRNGWRGISGARRTASVKK